ncbi:conserved oligomeric Golgi complex subunit 1 [Iris pallida]|uniref:Conserved oligomeric Golgi complex subunit 1 n=1 Tax=Iris pallida TaxID=29817 RepID=A0AAX6HH44_IRIPA|nr:conserved oligomeric Golgi complex subunit 1 [Iris pallida]
MANRDAESLFRSKPIAEIRSIESDTKRQIDSKKEELRLLVGASYRDLIDSADSILSMRDSCSSISSNLSAIDSAIQNLDPQENPNSNSSTSSSSSSRSKIYALACRVKYLVDTPENIWGTLEESMLLEASGRYFRAKQVHDIVASSETDILRRFPLLRHQWQIVESFRSQISQKSRERLADRGLGAASYADALAAAATVDDLSPVQVLALLLDSRREWISQRLSDLNSAAFCDVARMIRTCLGQVGEMFLLALNEMPLFYKMVLGSPPGSQLFGGIPNPDEEVRLWKLHREKLEAAMVVLEPEFVADTCCSWLRSCCDEMFGELTGGKRLMDLVKSGEELASTEKLVRETLDGREGLEGSLEQWLRSVFGSEIESPWNQIRGLILKEGKDILEDRLEEAFMARMKEIVQFGFDGLKKDLNIWDTVEVVAGPNNKNDFHSYLKKPSTGGGVWFSEPHHKKTPLGFSIKPIADENNFRNCLNAYFGPEVSRIRDAMDANCGNILEDLLCFVESHNSTLRLKDMAPYLQDNCYKTVSVILQELEDELRQLSASLESSVGEMESLPPSVIVERSLFIGRLLFSLRNHSTQIPLILGSPRQWVKESSGAAFANLASPKSKQSKGSFDSPISFSPRRPTFDSPRSPRRQFLDSPRRQTISAAAALFAVDGSTNPKLEELNRTLQELCIKAHSLWIIWVSNELSVVLAKDLDKDEALSASSPLRGWEVTVINQEHSSEGSPEMKVALPSMPSLYIISFLFQACLQIHKVGGHVLDKFILQNFAWRLLEKVVGIYKNFLSTMEAPESGVSEKGILQILLDLRFTADILSGGKDFNSRASESNTKGESLKNTITRPPFRRKHVPAGAEPVMVLIQCLSQRIDPIDWATYEPYLWENEKQSYKRHAVLFGFFVQLNRMHTETVQKLPTRANTDSNILRCSTVPRFKYLPISAPVLSSRGPHKSTLQSSADDTTSRSPWKAYSNGDGSPKPEFDDSLSSFGGATPLLKSFMTQVGSKFGESTSRWGSMLSDGQVGKLKDRSAAAMSTFGDMLPGPAAGLLSSFASGSYQV